MKAKTKKTKKQIQSTSKKIRHIVRLAVVPHKKNQYRPHLIRRYGLLALIAIAFGVQLVYNLSATGSVLGRESDITITSLYQQTNQTRLEEGLDSLKLNDQLNQAAYLKAQDMFLRQYWSHDAPDGTEPWKWFGDVGYNYDRAGENLAKNFNTTSGVMIAWLNSPQHKANVINSSYQDVGFAVVTGELLGTPTTLVVALYGAPASQAVAGATTVFNEPSANSGVNILTQFAVAIKSLTPAVMVALFLISVAVVVASVTHSNRHKLPAKLRKSWYKHHGLYKAIGLSLLAVFIIFLYSNGQI